MINARMRYYNYFTLGAADEYGQATIDYSEPVGTVKLAINITSQSVQDNINYQSAEYMGLTLESNVDDTYIIEYGNEKLKVKYVNPVGKYKQVFMVRL